VPLGAAFTTSFLAAIVQLVNEQQQKGRIRTMFSTYAPAQVVDRLIESGETPRLGGAKAEITAFFSDIQGFSTIAEQLEPEGLVEIMNEYLTTCTDAVYHESGLLDKYVGDAVVAMFGGLVSIPDHATRACAAAMLVQKRQRELCDRWKAAGRKFPDSIFWMRTRIGLNTGPAIVGNLGSRQRFTYTMMGDTVNLASRLEGACKYLGVYILVSQSVRDAVVANGGGFVFRKLDRIEVVGRVEPLDVYELMCAASELTDADEECLSRFSRARALYEQRRWDEAEKAFEACAHFERFQPGRDPEVHGNASLVFVQRCRILRANSTGAEWDGVFRLTEK
jgi:adenylate cyclase